MKRFFSAVRKFLLLLALISVGAAFFIQSDTGKAIIFEYLMDLATDALGDSDLSIHRVKTDYLSYLMIEDLVLTDREDEPLLIIESIRLSWEKLSPLDLEVEEVDLSLKGVNVFYLAREDGTNWSQAFPSSGESAPFVWSGSPVGIGVINARVVDAVVVSDHDNGSKASLSLSGSAEKSASIGMSLVGELTFLDELIALSAEVDLGAEDATDLKTHIHYGGFTASAQGGVSQWWSDPDVAVDLELLVQNGALGPYIGEELPLADLTLQIQASGTVEQAQLSLIQPELGIDLKGDLKESNWSAKLGISGGQIKDLLGVDVQLDIGLEAAGDLSLNEVVFDLSGGEQHLFEEVVRSLSLKGVYADNQVSCTQMQVAHDLMNLKGESTVDLAQMSAAVSTDIVFNEEGGWDRFSLPGVSGNIATKGTVAFADEVSVELDNVVLVDEMHIPEVVSAQRISGPVSVLYDESGYRIEGGLKIDQIRASDVNIQETQVNLQLVGDSSGNGELKGNLDLSKIDLLSESLLLEGVSGPFALELDTDDFSITRSELFVEQIYYVPGEFLIDGGPVELRKKGDLVEAELLLTRKSRTFVSLLVQGDLEQGVWKVEELAFTPIEGADWMTVAPIVFHQNDGHLELELESDEGRILIEGSLKDELTLLVEEIDLSYLAVLVETFLGDALIPIDSYGHLDARLSVADEGLEGQVELSDFMLPELVSSGTMLAEVDGTLLRPELAFHWADEQGAKLIELDGYWPLTSESLPDCAQDGSFNVRLHSQNMTDLSQHLLFVPSEDMIIDGRVVFSGAACDPEVVLEGSVTVPFEGAQISSSVLAVRDKDAVSLSGTLDWDKNRLMKMNGQIEGQYSALIDSCVFHGMCAPEISELGNLQLALDFPQIQAGDLIDIEQVEVGSQGQIEVYGTLDDLAAKGGFSVKGKVGKVSVSAPSLNLSYENQTVFSNGELFLGKGGGGSYQISMKDDMSDLSGDFELNKVPLRLLEAFSSDVEDVRGKMFASGKVWGSVEYPQTEISAHIEDGSFDVPMLRTQYRQLNAQISSSGETVKLESFGMKSVLEQPMDNKGELFASGSYHLRGEGLFECTMNEFLLSNTAQSVLSLSGDLQLDTSSVLSQVTGDIKVDKGVFVFGSDVFTENASLQLDPRIVLHHMPADKRPKPVKDEPLLPLGLLADVQLDLGNRVSVRAAVPTIEDYGPAFSKLATMLVDVGLVGQLTFGAAQGEPRLLGEVTMPRGTVTALGATFSLNEGSIFFVGKEYWNPEIDMDVSRSFGTYGDVVASIRGNPVALSMEFKSENGPQDYDQTDILSLLLLGQPTSELTEGQGQAGLFLVSAALASFGGNVSRAIGGSVLDEMSWDPSEGSLRIGKSLNEKLFLALERDSKADEDENLHQLSLDWQIMQRMYGEFVAGDANHYRAQIYYQWQF